MQVDLGAVITEELKNFNTAGTSPSSPARVCALLFAFFCSNATHTPWHGCGHLLPLQLLCSDNLTVTQDLQLVRPAVVQVDPPGHSGRTGIVSDKWSYDVGFTLGSQYFSNRLYIHTPLLTDTIVIPDTHAQLQGQWTGNKPPCVS